MPDKLNKKESVTEDLCVWFCLIESKPAAISVDCNAHETSKNSLPSLVVLTIFGLGVSRNGFPTMEVFETIYAIEDKIKNITARGESLYAARFITDGLAYYLIYTKNQQKIQKGLKELMNAYEDLKFDVSAREDTDWKVYYDMVYPPKKEKQKYQNSILRNEFMKQGDKTNKTRNVDHVITFNNEKDREKFIKTLPKSELSIKDHRLFNPEENTDPFTLELHILSSLDDEEINKTTDILIELADRYKGIYDGWGSEIAK